MQWSSSFRITCRAHDTSKLYAGKVGSCTSFSRYRSFCCPAGSDMYDNEGFSALSR